MMRDLIEMAAACGRKRKSEQTGFVHYCYGNQDPEPHYTIPLVENFLYALALLRSRSIENVNEAKDLLTRLLPFQSKNGDFPLYLHDYPHCKDRMTGLHVAAVICWILNGFTPILGQDLKGLLEKALVLAVTHARTTFTEKYTNYSASVKLECVSVAAGRLVHHAWEAEGLAQLELLANKPDEFLWHCPETLGELLAALPLAYAKSSESPWKHFWKHLGQTWHQATASYIGPAHKEWQWETEPQVTLYDLYMGYLTEGLSARARNDSICHLKAALIQPTNDIFSPQNEGVFGGNGWKIVKRPGYAYSYINQNKPFSDRSLYPFKLIWGDRDRVHTFVCQNGNSKQLQFSEEGEDILMKFNLDNPIAFEDREQCREVAFFYDMHEGSEFRVDGGKASTFMLNDNLTIKSHDLLLNMSFHLTHGEDRFLGHRMPGNRPSQIGARGEKRFQAHDWQLFLRTIHRAEECSITVRLKVHQ